MTAGTEERLFFDSSGISVSNSRFIAHGQTYAMASITSVKFLKRPPSSPVAVLCFLGGVIAMFFGGAGIALGIFLVAVSFVVAKSARPKYSLLLNTSSGETKALESEDQFLIESVVSALNASIVYRG